MFANMKIGLKLAIGFVTTLVLLIIIAVIGVNRISALNQEVNVLVKNQFPKTVYASNVVENINVVARHLRNAIIYSGDEQATALKSLQDARDVIGQNLDKLDKVITSDKGRDLLAKVKSARTAYVVDQDRVIALIKADKKAETVGLLQGDMRKSQAAYLKSMGDLNDF